MGPLWRHLSTEPPTSHPLKIHLSVRVPGKGAPSMFPNMVLMDRDTPPPEPLVYSFIHSLIHSFIHSFIHSCMSAAVPKRSPPTQGAKHKVTVHQAPPRWKACIQWGAAWFPKGIVKGTAVSTPVSCSPWHDTLHLGLVRPEPR